MQGEIYAGGMGVRAAVGAMGSDATLALARGAGLLARTSFIVGSAAALTTKKGVVKASSHVMRKVDAKLEVSESIS